LAVCRPGSSYRARVERLADAGSASDRDFPALLYHHQCCLHGSDTYVVSRISTNSSQLNLLTSIDFSWTAYSMGVSLVARVEGIGVDAFQLVTDRLLRDHQVSSLRTKSNVQNSWSWPTASWILRLYPGNVGLPLSEVLGSPSPR
jgi:hypothetical protein